MAKYLDPIDIQDLIETRNKIFEIRNAAYQKHGIDVLDNDTLSSLSIWEIVSNYDPDYNVNFSRNGEDALSNGVKIEQKCSNIKPKKNGKLPNADFQFHALGDIEYPRYILAVRDKNTLELIKIYDIQKKENTKAIVEHLLEKRKNWLDAGAKKYDVITQPEKVLLENITFSEKTVKNCKVFVD